MSLSNSFIYLSSLFFITFIIANATTFEVRNQCPYTIWAAAIPGGGQQLNPGQTWAFFVDQSTRQGCIWGRTYCNFNASGSGRCKTGDCNGLLQCEDLGQPPRTLAEYSLNAGNRDFFDVSLVKGFNIPMDFSPLAGECRGIRCSANINGQCPNELRVDGGCNNPCTVFKTAEYCCNTSAKCGPTNLSRFFKERCGDAYSYPLDDKISIFTCPAGTNYRVVFCP